MHRSAYLAFTTFLLGICFMPFASAQIYRCTVDGKVVFSDTGCGNDAVAIEKPRVNVLSGPVAQEAEPENSPEPQAVINDEPELAAVESECTSMSSQEVRKKVIEKKVFVGMRESDVIKSWGKPTRINRSSHGSDQWVYDRGVGAQYVYIGNEGCVTAWN